MIGGTGKSVPLPCCQNNHASALKQGSGHVLDELDSGALGWVVGGYGASLAWAVCGYGAAVRVVPGIDTVNVVEGTDSGLIKQSI